MASQGWGVTSYRYLESITIANANSGTQLVTEKLTPLQFLCI